MSDEDLEKVAGGIDDDLLSVKNKVYCPKCHKQIFTLSCECGWSLESSMKDCPYCCGLALKYADGFKCTICQKKL